MMGSIVVLLGSCGGDDAATATASLTPLFIWAQLVAVLPTVIGLI